MQCYHCGEPLAAAATIRATLAGSTHGFCCTGCKAAAEWLHQSGLADYYDLRSVPTARVDLLLQFGDWDSSSFRRMYVRESDGISECDLSIAHVRCAACAWLIERVAGRLPGVESILVDPATTSARLRFDPAQTSLGAIATHLSSIGYPPSVVHDAPAAASGRRASLKRLAVAGLGAMQAMMFTEVLYWGEGTLDVGTRDFFRVIAALITTVVVFYSGAPFFRGAWREWRMRQPGMDVLVALSVGLAYATSLVETIRGGPVVYFDAAVMFVFLLAAARHVEAIARSRATERLRLIVGAQSQRAERVDRAGQAEMVAVCELQAGDHVRVASGDAVPVDGTLLQAPALLDESLLSGESRSVAKRIGDVVYAGSTALEAPLLVEVVAVGTATRLGQLSALVSKGLHREGNAAAAGARVAAYFTTVMLLVAAATCAWWWIEAPERALPATLAVLAAACPCAFALAAPAALAAAHAALAQSGVIVTRHDALAKVARVDRIVTDKTGTLSKGRPQLVAVELLRAGVDRPRALAIAAALERGHSHPIAHAFRAFDLGLEVANPKLVAGIGVTGTMDGSDWQLGRAAWLDASQPDGLLLADGSGVVARFVIEDALREESIAAVRSWKRFAAVEMLSGDAEVTVAAVAERLGIRWRSRCTPEQKRDHVAALQTCGHRVLMLGDGLNDAESLAVADVGVAMGGGSAIAQGHADVLLLRDDLRLIPTLIDTARRARRITRQNMAWAVGYHLLVLPFAVSGMMAPWLAALGMALSSLIVVMNALRLRHRASAEMEQVPSPLHELPA